MLLTISLNINNTLCYIICWHVFVRNIVTSICKITTSSCIIGLTKVFICLIVAPINGLNLVLHFFRQELNSFLLMPSTTLVPNTCFPTKTNCFIVLGISWDNIFTFFRNTKCICLRKSIYNWCRSSFACIYIVFYIAVKCILVFVDIVIYPIIDARFGYFIFVDKKGWYLLLTSIELNPVVDSLLFLTVFQVLSVIIRYIVFIKINFWC